MFEYFEVFDFSTGKSEYTFKITKLNKILFAIVYFTFDPNCEVLTKD